MTDLVQTTTTISQDATVTPTLTAEATSSTPSAAHVVINPTPSAATSVSEPVAPVAAAPGFISGLAQTAGKYVFIVLLVAVAGLFWLWHGAKADFEEADNARASLKVRYDALLIDQELKQKSDAANQAIIADLNKQLAGKSTQVDSVSKTIDGKIAAIDAKYAKLDRTETNRIAQEREVSTERIRGLWQVYCIANPKNERCVAPVTPVAVTK